MANRNSDKNTDGSELWNRLMRERIVFIGGRIEPAMANIVVAQLHFLAREDPNREVAVYINSEDGDVRSGLAIYDTMQEIAPPVATMCVGRCMDIASVLLSAGTKGKRACVRSGQVFVSQGSISFRGTPTDIEAQALDLLSCVNRMADILAENCARDRDRVLAEMRRGWGMNAEEAIAYGIVDHVITPESAHQYNV